MAKNFITFKQLDWECIRMARIAGNDINPHVRQAVINDRTYKLYGLLDGINDPIWNEVVTLTVLEDQEFLQDAVTNGANPSLILSAVITAINATGITRESGQFVAKSLLNITIALKADGTFVAQWLARVTTGGATAEIATISGTPATFDYTVHTCYVHVIKTLSTSSADLSGNYVKSIIKIYDDQGSGGKERLFDLYTDPRAYGEAWDDPFNAKRIVCLHYGETVAFSVGSKATAMGIVQALVKGKPALFTDATMDNLINTPPEENAMLCDEIAAEYARLAGKAVPEDIAARLAQLNKLYESAAASKSKALGEQGQRTA